MPFSVLTMSFIVSVFCFWLMGFAVLIVLNIDWNEVFITGIFPLEPEREMRMFPDWQNSDFSL